MRALTGASLYTQVLGTDASPLVPALFDTRIKSVAIQKMQGKVWAGVAVAVAALCVVVAVYIVVSERRDTDGNTPRMHAAPSLPAAAAVTQLFKPPKATPPKSDAPRVPPPVKQVPQPPEPQHKSRYLMMREDVMNDKLVAPPVQVRSPLVVPHHLEYTLRHRKYTFQSDQRDQLMYPSPAYYRLKLLVPLRNVVAITLSSGVFPITEYNVNAYNQYVDIDVGGTVYTVQVPQGEYTESTLAPAVQTAIQALGPPLAGVTVTLDPLTRRITVANAAAFTLLFRTGPSVNKSMWQVLGFLQLDTTPALSTTAPGMIDLAGALAIDMFIEEVSCNIDSTDNAVARISLQKFTPVSSLTYFTPTNYGVLRKFWPIGRLQYLTFQFMVKVSELQPDGQVIVKYRPYDFNERNHTMQLAFSCKEYESPQDEFVELDPQS